MFLIQYIATKRRHTLITAYLVVKKHSLSSFCDNIRIYLLAFKTPNEWNMNIAFLTSRFIVGLSLLCPQ